MIAQNHKALQHLCALYYCFFIASQQVKQEWHAAQTQITGITMESTPYLLFAVLTQSLEDTRHEVSTSCTERCTSDANLYGRSLNYHGIGEQK